MQSKLTSALEVTLNLFLGYIVAVISQLIIFPLYGIDVTAQSHLIIGAWFTLINSARMYIIRRCFNAYSYKSAQS